MLQLQPRRKSCFLVGVSESDERFTTFIIVSHFISNLPTRFLFHYPPFDAHNDSGYIGFNSSKCQEITREIASSKRHATRERKWRKIKFEIYNVAVCEQHKKLISLKLFFLGWKRDAELGMIDGWCVFVTNHFRETLTSYTLTTLKMRKLFIFNFHQCRHCWWSLLNISEFHVVPVGVNMPASLFPHITKKKV